MSRTYVTVQGDMWDYIAYTQLGSEHYIDALIAANRKYKDIYIFPAGIVLELPRLSGNEKSANLPPWKRVSG